MHKSTVSQSHTHTHTRTHARTLFSVTAQPRGKAKEARVLPNSRVFRSLCARSFAKLHAFVSFSMGYGKRRKNVLRVFDFLCLFFLSFPDCLPCARGGVSPEERLKKTFLSVTFRLFCLFILTICPMRYFFCRWSAYIFLQVKGHPRFACVMFGGIKKLAPFQKVGSVRHKCNAVISLAVGSLKIPLKYCMRRVSANCGVSDFLLSSS